VAGVDHQRQFTSVDGAYPFRELGRADAVPQRSCHGLVTLPDVVGDHVEFATRVGVAVAREEDDYEVVRRILLRNAITRGIWEAKDTKDNLRVEIAKKIDKII
jgi:hypothetical protein